MTTARRALFRGLVRKLAQMDELYAKVRDNGHARWLWLAIDPVSKVIPSLHLGGRKKEDAYAVSHDLKERLDPDCVPSFMTDSLWSYFYALTAHFGHWFRPKRARTDHWAVDEEFRHGQLVKRKAHRTLKYAIQRIAWGKRSELFDVLEANGFRRVIQTAFTERMNLTFRQCIAALARQTWSLLSEQPLLHHAEWFRLYYHLARPHESLRAPIPGLKGKYRDHTPAMALGITDRVMTVGDILTHAADTDCGAGCAARCATTGQTEQGRRGESVDLTRLSPFRPPPELPISVGSPPAHFQII